MQIIVKSVNSVHMPLELSSSNSIGEVKAKIQDEYGIPVGLQRLIFAGIMLTDEYTLAYYGIQNQSTLHIVLRLRACDGCQICTQSKWLGHASPGVGDDRQTVLYCVSQQGQALRDASAELQADREIVLTAVAQDNLALQYASPAFCTRSSCLPASYG